MLGERIRQARLMSKMTLREVVEKLSRMGKPLSRQTLSNYEIGKRTPNPSTLIFLARATGVKPSYFFETPTLKIEWLAYRSHTSLRQKDKNAIEAKAHNVAEKFIYLSDSIMTDFTADFPGPFEVNNASEAENAAEMSRAHWNLGSDPIESLALTIESKGGIVSDYAATDISFDGLSGWVNEKIPIIIINSEIPPDRQRFNLAHELGHLVMDCSGVDGKVEEKLAHRFAGALLAPAEAVRRNFVSERKQINWQELGLMKRHYGISMQALMFRLRDLEIISDSTFKQYYRRFNWQGWRTSEPYKFTGDEKPVRLKQMVLYALAEGIITSDKAEEICPGCTQDVETSDEDNKIPDMSPKKIMKLTLGERRKILREAAKNIKKEAPHTNLCTRFGSGSLPRQ